MPREKSSTINTATLTVSADATATKKQGKAGKEDSQTTTEPTEPTEAAPALMPEPEEVDEAETIDFSADKKLPKPNKNQERLDRLKRHEQELAKKGRRLTQRDIVNRVGCSFNTAQKLSEQLKILANNRITVEAVVSEAAIDAIRNEITRNIDSFRDSIQEKLDYIEQWENTLDMAISLLDDIMNVE